MWGNTDMVLMTSQAAIVATSSCGVDRHYKEREGNTLVPATPPAQNGVHCTRSECYCVLQIFQHCLSLL